MSDVMEFANREEFRKWLAEHCLASDGVWLLFGKAGGPQTIKAAEALEEALCFGWIDGQMQSIDDKTYRKYFARRREKSKWSEKNKALVKSLEERGLMTDFGRQKIEEARQNGQWDAPKANYLRCRAAGGIRAGLYQLSGYAFIRKKNLHQSLFCRQNRCRAGKTNGLDGGQA